MERRKLRRPQHLTKNHTQRRDADREKMSVPQEREQELSIQYQMISPRNIYIQHYTELACCIGI